MFSIIVDELVFEEITWHAFVSAIKPESWHAIKASLLLEELMVFAIRKQVASLDTAVFSGFKYLLADAIALDRILAVIVSWC